MTGKELQSKGYANHRVPRGAGIGRELFYTDRIVAAAGIASPADTPAQQSGFCYLVREADPPMWLCQAGYILPEGLPDIPGGRDNQFHGVTLTNFEPDLNYVSAIIGGTGAYKDARGELTGIADRPDGLSWDVSITWG